MRLLLDTNVVLDVLLDRSAFSAQAAEIFTLIEHAEAEGWLCATTIPTVSYLMAKETNRKTAKKGVELLLDLFRIAPVDGGVLKTALDRGFADYEDAILHEAAAGIGAEVIITRNAKDFKEGRIKALTPAEFLAVHKGGRRQN